MIVAPADERRVGCLESGTDPPGGMRRDRSPLSDQMHSTLRRPFDMEGAPKFYLLKRRVVVLALPIDGTLDVGDTGLLLLLQSREHAATGSRGCLRGWAGSEATG